MLFILVISHLYSLISAACPDGTLEYPLIPPSKCYSFITTKSTFTSAETTCNKAGGSLTSLHDAFTNSFIREEAALLFRDSGASDFWIGASRSSDDNNWSWTDKSAFDFSDFKNATNENNFVLMSTIDGMWITADGNAEKQFVCETNNDLILLTTISPATPVSSCPDDWYFFEDTNSCYYASDFFTWEKGEEYCKSQEGHLASFHSAAERDFALSVYRGSLWMGLYTNESTITRNTTWKWTDGSQVDYLPWFYSYFTTDIPSCIKLAGTSSYPTLMNANCTDTYYSLCKKPAATSPVPTRPASTPQTSTPCLDGWKYLNSTNSCYIQWQYSEQEGYANWSTAVQHCIYLDAQLTSIHSQEELNFVQKFGCGDYETRWIGLYSDNNADSWKWVDGSPLDFRSWNVNNPIRGGKPCVNFRSYGYSNDEDCFRGYAITCKKVAFKTRS